jgi:hypothetical protein
MRSAVGIPCRQAREDVKGLRAQDLKGRHGSIASARSEVLAAIDYLFFGV